MGFVLEGLETEDYDRNYSDRELLKRILGYFRPYSRQIFFIAITLTLNAAFSTAGPIIIAKAIDIISENPSTNAILLLSVGVLIFGTAAWVFNYIRQLFSAKVVGNMVLTLREDAFCAAIGHDLSFYDQHPSGKIVSRITSDTQDFSNVMALVVDLLSQILLIIILAKL